MNKINTTFNEILNSNENSSTAKLQDLNINPYLNSFLIKKNYNPIVKHLLHSIKTDSEREVNIDVMKFYLHELDLIFNLNIPKEIFKGAVL